MRISCLRLIRPATLLCALVGIALPASAQMYKWTDERGVVSYSNNPPPAAAKGKVEAIEDRVSVYSTDDETKRAMSAEKAREAKRPSLGNRLETESRRPQRTPPQPSAREAREAVDYQRCIENRGVDCENLRGGLSSNAAPMDYGSGYGAGQGFVYLPPPAIVGGRPPRQEPFVVGPSPIPRVGISTAPPVGLNTQPPIGSSNTPPVGAPPRNRPRESR